MWRLIANLLTLSVFILGAAVIADPRPAAQSAGLVIAAALLDGADGWVARRAGGPSRYGALLDLVADWTAFGLAPVMLVLAHFGLVGPQLSPGAYWTGEGRCVMCPDSPAGLVFLVPAAGLLLCASLYRLARQALAPHAAGSGFTGMPMPANGLMVMVFGALSPHEMATALALVAVSALAVSRKRYPALPWLWRHARTTVLVTVGLMTVMVPVSPFAALLVGSAAYACAPFLVTSSD